MLINVDVSIYKNVFELLVVYAIYIINKDIYSKIVDRSVLH